jgi:hypothetical protein
MAAEALQAAAGDYSAGKLQGYEARLRARSSSAMKATPAPTIDRLSRRLGTWLLGRPWFVRRVVLDRWFLGRHQGSTF